ncbi:hypothetical protein FHR93_004724 [Geodermatophilus sabuli]|nr:hypothetical protein [Geodermatophilus sabuli]
MPARGQESGDHAVTRLDAGDARADGPDGAGGHAATATSSLRAPAA